MNLLNHAKKRPKSALSMMQFGLKKKLVPVPGMNCEMEADTVGVRAMRADSVSQHGMRCAKSG